MGSERDDAEVRTNTADEAELRAGHDDRRVVWRKSEHDHGVDRCLVCRNLLRSNRDFRHGERKLLAQVSDLRYARDVS